MEKEEKLFSSQRGITLIALIITIIVLLILAGITISLVVGDNGVLNQSTKAVERTSHGQVQEQVQMELANYEADKRTGETDKTSIEYLVDDGYLIGVEGEDYYIVSPDKTNGANLGKGKDKTTGDVYVVEEGEDNNWTLSYYGESNDKEPEKLFEFRVDEDPNVVHFIIKFEGGEGYNCKCIKGETLKDWFEKKPSILSKICGPPLEKITIECDHFYCAEWYEESGEEDVPGTDYRLELLESKRCSSGTRN